MRKELDRYLDLALGDDPRLAVAAARQLREEVGWIEQRAVALARREGYDWARIGRLLGTSRQSARERFSRQLPRLRPSPVRHDDVQRQHDEIERMFGRLTEDRYQAGLGDGEVTPW
jgi:hypothetical protein